MVKYPDVVVNLTGQDGNAFSILGIVGEQLKRHGIDQKEIDLFRKEAMSGDYNNLLQVCMKWVTVE